MQTFSFEREKKKFFLLSPVFVFDSSVVISVFFFASSFKCVILCVRRRVVLLGAKLKHFDLQIAIDYNTITARTTTLPDPSSWRPINLQNNENDINSIEKERAANIMYLKSTIKWNAAAVVVVFFFVLAFSPSIILYWLISLLDFYELVMAIENPYIHIYCAHSIQWKSANEGKLLWLLVNGLRNALALFYLQWTEMIFFSSFPVGIFFSATSFACRSRFECLYSLFDDSFVNSLVWVVMWLAFGLRGGSITGLMWINKLSKLLN